MQREKKIREFHEQIRKNGGGERARMQWKTRGIFGKRDTPHAGGRGSQRKKEITFRFRIGNVAPGRKKKTSLRV